MTGFYFANNDAQVYISGHCGQKTKFSLSTSPSIKVEQAGCLRLYLQARDELYTVSFPELYIRGLITGSVFLELTGNSKIECSNGLCAFIDFVQKPWFSGEYNVIKGTIFKSGNDKAPLYTLSGKWTEKTFATPVNAVSGSTSPILLFDCEMNPMVEPQQSKPLNEMDEMESLRLWGPVTEALKAGDYSRASKEKTEIEERQRALRREREKSQEAYSPRYFRYVYPSDFVGKSNGYEFTAKGKDIINGLDPEVNRVPSKNGSASGTRGGEGFWVFVGKE